MDKKKLGTVLELAIVYVLLLLVVTFSAAFVQLGGTVPVRMALYVAIYIVIAAIVILALVLRKIPLGALGFKKKNISRQLLAAIPIFIVTVSVAVVIPLLLGANKTDVLSFKSSSLQVLIFYLFFDFICVGFGEELAFRGYFYSRIQSLSSIPWLPMVLTAVMFGFWHYPVTQSFLNVAVTSVLGLFYGYCRWKRKNCTVLSLSVAHGLHDAFIITLSYFLL